LVDLVPRLCEKWGAFNYKLDLLDTLDEYTVRT
jgi:hypothetical protein